MALILNLKLSLKNYINSLLFCGLFFPIKTSAQPYLAGNITYSWINGYTYSVKLTTYTGTGNMNDPCQDAMCNGPIMNRVNGPSIICSSPAHDGVLISPTIKMNEYIMTQNFPGTGNYILCSEELNRNQGIINIPGSINQTMHLESFLIIPTLTSGKNNSPTFANHPIAYGCLNNGCFTYNPMATDIDGDSLSYKLVPCMGNSGSIIPGYSYPSGGTGGSCSINPISGLLTWCTPQYAGDYNVGIQVEEWRKNDDGEYFLIGYVIRDTQFTIDGCTGINDSFEKEQPITVYPNPATDHIEIKFKEVSSELYTIDLTDITGKTVTRFLENSTAKPSLKFDMKAFSNGIYFIKITGNNKTTVKKLIKQ